MPCRIKRAFGLKEVIPVRYYSVLMVKTEWLTCGQYDTDESWSACVNLFRLSACGQRLCDEFQPHCSLDFGCHIRKQWPPRWKLVWEHQRLPNRWNKDPVPSDLCKHLMVTHIHVHGVCSDGYKTLKVSTNSGRRRANFKIRQNTTFWSLYSNKLQSFLK